MGGKEKSYYCKGEKTWKTTLEKRVHKNIRPYGWVTRETQVRERDYQT